MSIHDIRIDCGQSLLIVTEVCCHRALSSFPSYRGSSQLTSFRPCAVHLGGLRTGSRWQPAKHRGRHAPEPTLRPVRSSSRAGWVLSPGSRKPPDPRGQAAESGRVMFRHAERHGSAPGYQCVAITTGMRRVNTVNYGVPHDGRRSPSLECRVKSADQVYGAAPFGPVLPLPKARNGEDRDVRRCTWTAARPHSRQP